MNRPRWPDLPERLLESDATDFERRVLDAALQKQPSSAASARMAKALGVTAATVGTATAANDAGRRRGRDQGDRGCGTPSAMAVGFGWA